MAMELTLDDVRKVARLARLKLDEAALEQYRSELTGILQHVARLQEIDVRNVEPMAYPSHIVNRLADDVDEPSLQVQALLSIAPQVEGEYLAVPKVLDQ
jgi:aspartyl-tRNA(Asn)/glutamyl-tRNA(Gln) amidotransferase subunit C